MANIPQHVASPKPFAQLLAIELALYLANVAVIAVCLRLYFSEGFLGLSILFGFPLLLAEHFVLRRKIGRNSDSVVLGLAIFLVLLTWLGSKIGHLR